MTERRENHEGLDPVALAALRALREEEDVPADARARVWARLAAATAEEAEGAGPKRQGAWARSSGPWVVVVLAAAALVLLGSRAGVLDRLVASRGGEAARYTEIEGARPGEALVERARPAVGVQAAPAADGAEAKAADSGTGPEGHALKDVSGETAAEARGERVGRAAGRSGSGGAGGRRSADGVEAGGPGAEAGGPGAEAGGPGAEAGGLAAEAEALARAQAAIQGGEAEAALVELAGYARRFPQGALHEEHDALRAIALCAAGRSREGRGEAQAFLRARPGSALAERVRGACLAP